MQVTCALVIWAKLRGVLGEVQKESAKFDQHEGDKGDEMDVEGDEIKAWMQLHQIAGEWAIQVFTQRAVVREKHESMLPELLDQAIEDPAKDDESMDIEDGFVAESGKMI